MPSIGREVDDRRSDDSDRRRGSDAGQLAFETLRQRDVVRVEASDVPAFRLVESAVQRTCEAELLVVSEEDESAVGDPGQELRRFVGRGVVDDDELEIPGRGVEDAVHGSPEERRIVVNGEQD